MANRYMIHRGKVKTKIPAVFEEEINPETGAIERTKIEDEKQMEMELSPGSAFGNFPIGVPVEVPKKMQPILAKKGFEFVSDAELNPLREAARKADKARQEEVRRAFRMAAQGPGGVSGQGKTAVAEEKAEQPKKGGGE